MNSPSAGTDHDRRILRLVGIYDADGTLRGEIAYWVGARLGRAHCALCDVTHGLTRERAAWRSCRAGLPVPFDTYHRDDQPDAIRTATGNVAPTVVADTAQGIVLLLSPADIDACAASAVRLVESIERAVVREALVWPAG